VTQNRDLNSILKSWKAGKAFAKIDLFTVENKTLLLLQIHIHSVCCGSIPGKTKAAAHKPVGENWHIALTGPPGPFSFRPLI
jgi:hypothetical protein